MTLLEILEKGLSVLENSVNQHRDALTAQLAIREKISDEDSAWLDDIANLVEEQSLVAQLQESSDFEHTLSNLDPKDISLVEKPKVLTKPRAAAVAKVIINNKQKRPQRKKPEKGKKDLEPVFTKKENATVAQCIEILDWHHAQTKRSQTKTAEHFNKNIPISVSSSCPQSLGRRAEKLYKLLQCFPGFLRM
ncbi:hypothetical protein B0H14DRAFT_3489596 [Mycena olivaceomarginata]|nr:hypothetical protein B0H14DRAFT_3489596 [Mycena olivaceomarginata]